MVLPTRKLLKAKYLFVLVITLVLTISFFAPQIRNKVLNFFFSEAQAEIPDSYQPKVLVLIYNQVLESQNNLKVAEYMGWNDPDSLNSQLINTFSQVSSSRVYYNVVERIESDSYPIKNDGFQYDDDTYLACLSQGSNCHQPDLVNYQEVLNSVDACGKLNRGEIDEVWVWGGPWLGFYESNLAGPAAFWYNSPPTSNTTCQKLLPIMAFNFERQEEEALESYGHRVESTLSHVYGSWDKNQAHTWNKFTLLDVDSPGNGGCGNAHLGVNAASNTGYDRTNPRTVDSLCEDFLEFPDLTGNTTPVNCENWSCTTLGYMKWWYQHFPHANGIGIDGKYNNWWAYLVDVQNNVVNPGTFSNLSGNLEIDKATFNFGYTNATNSYQIDLSTTADMSWDVYINFASGLKSPIMEINPTKWDKYSCGRTLYWRVYAHYNGQRHAQSPIQTTTVTCPDLTAPTTTIVDPIDNEIVSGIVDITATAEDDRGIDYVEFYVDNQLLDLTTSAPYTASWDSTDYPHNSLHTLFSTAYDTSGNSATSEVVSVQVNDIKPPSVDITYPLANQGVKGTIIITADTSDVSGIDKVEFYVNGGLKCTDSAVPYSCSWKVPSKSGVNYTITAKAYDSVGNTNSDSVSVVSIK